MDIINNSNQITMYTELSRELQNCNSFIFNVAFINFGGLQLLLDDLSIAEKKGIKGKILTSTYLNFTDPKALSRIKEFKNIKCKIFIPEKNLGFHSKCYIFEYETYYKIYIGSSNITQSALKSNIEWNVWIDSKKDSYFANKILKEFNSLWNSTNLESNNENFIMEYEKHLSGYTKKRESIGLFKPTKTVKLNYMQIKAIESLKRIRTHNENRALVVASTGSGKTYMSAFDVKEYNPNSILFLVHREDILRQARDTFASILPHKMNSLGFFTGSEKDENKPYLFSTLQSLNNHYEKFLKNQFEYIIIDEAHHAASPTYVKLINYFQPKFLLGMTATPERGDGECIYEIFGNNLALDLRLREALEHELVVPFHYYGITDIPEVNFSNISLNNTSEVAKLLNINKRVEFIIEKIKFYGHDGVKTKGLAFCVSVDHAEYMCKEFNRHNIPSATLTGSDTPERRKKIIDELEDDFFPLNFIFTVDIFNEGVDIPSINLVLMLRPTNSPIIFIQQLGRGLRKHDSKDFLTVLDFIGNHDRAFLIALALAGNKYYDKDSLKIAVKNDFSDIPGCVHVKMDSISKERILQQIELENFNALKYLKEEYFEFKKLNGNNVPFMTDFLKFDCAPNPMKFAKFGKTYIGFLQKIDPEIKENIKLFDVNFLWILKEITEFLPLKRIHEFVILKLLLKNETVTVNEIEYELAKYLKQFDFSSLIHSIKVLQWDFLSEKEKVNSSSKPFPILKFNEKEGLITRELEFSKILYNPIFSPYIKDIISYGINRYEEEFGAEYYGIPHFKLYETYTQFHTALLSNYEKSHSSFRGSGVLKNGNNYFLFITLHKESWGKNKKFNNVFLDNRTVTFFSKNTTSIESESGKDLIFNKERGKKLHLFVRKFVEVDKVIQPFIYLGMANATSHKGEKPIKIILQLENEIDWKVYRELI